MKALLIAVLVVTACADDGGGSINEQEVITTVTLAFEPVGASPIVKFEVDDPDGDGGDPPIVDPIEIGPGSYTLRITFENRLETPAEDITEEILAEGNDHLVVLTGTAVVGPATSNATGPLAHAYADTDANGLPIGIVNDIVATVGTGELTVTLRHMPPELPPVKGTDTLDIVRDEGVGAIGGSTDARVTFPVTVVQ